MVDGESTPLYSERNGPITEEIMKQQKRQFNLSKQKSKLHYSIKNFNTLCQVLDDFRMVYQAKQIVSAMDQI